MATLTSTQAADRIVEITLPLLQPDCRRYMREALMSLIVLAKAEQTLAIAEDFDAVDRAVSCRPS